MIAEQPVESADGISISRVGHVGDVVGAHDVGGETADASENAGVFADATGVLAHGDITRIVVPVFNPPVCPDGAAGGVGGEHGVRHVVGGFAGQVPEAGRGVAFEAAAVDPNDGGDKGCPFGVAEMGARIEDLDVSRPRGVDGLMAVERLALVAYADMIPRIQALAENPDVPAVTRAPMMQVLENHQRYLSTRKHIEDYLDQVDRHIEEHDSMESLAEELDMKVAEISDYPDWRRENDRLTTAGEAILSDMETHGPHLDNILIGKARMNWALLNMSRAIRRDDEAISKEAIAAEELLAQLETPEEREQRAEREALKFRRLQSAADNAATQEEREAAQKEFDDYVERHSDSPGEEEHEGRSISRSWSIRL